MVQRKGKVEEDLVAKVTECGHLDFLVDLLEHRGVRKGQKTRVGFEGPLTVTTETAKRMKTRAEGESSEAGGLANNTACTHHIGIPG